MASAQVCASMAAFDIDKGEDFTEYSKALKDHLQPEPNQISERFHFFKRDRKHCESVSDYIAELRHLSERCGFGTELNTYLRDRFVCGLSSETIQQKLLTVKDLTLEKALQVAHSYETASRDAKLIRGGGSAGSAAVNQMEPYEDEHIHRMQQKQSQRRPTGKCNSTASG